jgi:hypothetical protein
MLGLYVADLYEAYSTDLGYCARTAPELWVITHLPSQLVYFLCPATLKTILVLFSGRGSAAVHIIDVCRSRDHWLPFDPLGTQNPVLNRSALLKFLPA